MTNHAAQLAIIKQVTRQESRSSAGNCDADEPAGITQLSRPWSRDSAGTATLSSPSPTAGHRWPKPLPEAPGHSRVSVCTAAATAAAKSLQSCPTLCDPIDGSPQGSRPWDSPGKNNGVGCHFLFQCMKVKSESEVAQSCLTLSDPMDCSLPGYSIHGIFQARVL